MATKAQIERARQERSKPGRPPKKPRARRDVPVDTAQPGVSATDRRAGAGNTAARNYGERVARKASVALEDSATKPSRKSTRGGANRIKPSSNLTRAAQRKSRTPEAKATLARTKATAVRGKGRGRA